MTVRSGEPPQILICDRDPQIVRALRTLLRPHGFGVVPTATGEEALAAAAEHAPHAAIVELRRKIEPAGGPWRYIRTASGVGYRFVGV